MNRWKSLKLLVTIGFLIVGLIWVAAATSKSAIANQKKKIAAMAVKADPADFVGDDSCKVCHEDQFKSYATTAHIKLAETGEWTAVNQGCESCHGPGKAHAEAGGDKTKIVRFSEETAKKISDKCLTCHAGREEHNNYRRGEHWRNDVGCLQCHSLHTSASGSQKMLTKKEPELCISCHSEAKAQFSKPSHHKVFEGSMKCTDCHNPHGGFESKQLRLSTGVDAACLKCHTDKQGLFVFEHAPLKVEGCSICHTPHGSSNAKMLKRGDTRQLCLECHTDILGNGVGAPGEPTFHTAVKYQNCTVCHAKIHGSNTSNRFFR